MTQIIDYTKMRRNSMVDNKYICVCPNCGKKGLRSVHPATATGSEQTTIYAHEGRQVGQFGRIEINKSCAVTLKVTAKFDDLDPALAEYQHIKAQWANRPEANY